MIKAIFVPKKIDKEKIDKLKQLGFNSVFVNYKNLNEQAIELLRKGHLRIFVEIGIFPNLCPNDEIVQQNKLSEVEDIIKAFQIDGIWLDFIRFPLLWEIKNPQIKNAHVCSKCRHVKNRLEIISSFVSQIRTLLHRLQVPIVTSGPSSAAGRVAQPRMKPKASINQSGKNIKLGMFSVPWKEEDFGGAITKVIGQDFRSLAEYIDIFSPMVYHKMCSRTTRWIHDTVVYMGKTTGKPILPIIQTENRPEKIGKEEFNDAITSATKKPSIGAIVFFFEDLLKDKDKVNVVQQVLRRGKF